MMKLRKINRLRKKMWKKIVEDLTSVQPINIKFPKGFWTKPWYLIIKKGEKDE